MDFYGAIQEPEEYAKCQLNKKIFYIREKWSLCDYEKACKSAAFETIINALSNIYLYEESPTYIILPPHTPPNTSEPFCYRNWYTTRTQNSSIGCCARGPRFVSWLKEFAELFKQKGYKTYLIERNPTYDGNICFDLYIYVNPEHMLKEAYQRRMREQVLPALIQAAWHPRRVAFILSEAGMSD